MTDVQENKLSMYYKVRTFLDLNLNTISPNVIALVGEKERFNELLSELEAHLSEASEDITGVAEQKQYNREQLRQKMLELSGSLRSFLILQGDKINAQKVHITKSEFDAKRDGEVHHLYDKITSIATLHLDDLGPFGFDAPRLAQVTTAFNLFNSTIGLPGDERSQNASHLRNAIEHFDLIDDELEIIDGLMLSVSAIHHTLYIQYTLDRLIDDTGSGTTIPPDYTVTIAAGAFVSVVNIDYAAARVFRAKNLGGQDINWCLSNNELNFSNPPTLLSANSTSNKLSRTLAPDGDYLVFQNPSAEPVEIEVTIME